MSGFDELQVAVERGEREAVVSMVKDALDGGTDPADILNDGLIAAMQAVGEKMEEGDMFIPEVLRAAKTMQAGLEILEPHLVEGTVESAGKVVVGTVKGDGSHHHFSCGLNRSFNQVRLQYLQTGLHGLGGPEDLGDKHIPLLHLFTNCLHRRNQAIIQN